MPEDTGFDYKTRSMAKNRGASKWRAYADLAIGSASVAKLLRYEVIMLLCANIGGAIGIFLRSRLYPLMLGSVGQNVAFGKGITFRHPAKIRIGDGVIIDDFCVIDAKGRGNKGVWIQDEVFVGRNTVIYCKGGDIRLGRRVNIGGNCMIYSKNQVSIGSGTIIAAFAHIMSGGQYDYQSSVLFADQSSMSRGPTIIGKNCWIGSKVVVQDGVEIGSGSVIGSGAVVTKNIPKKVVAVGVPAQIRASVNKRD